MARDHVWPDSQHPLPGEIFQPPLNPLITMIEVLADEAIAHMPHSASPVIPPRGGETFPAIGNAPGLPTKGQLKPCKGATKSLPPRTPPFSTSREFVSPFQGFHAARDDEPGAFPLAGNVMP